MSRRRSPWPWSPRRGRGWPPPSDNQEILPPNLSGAAAERLRPHSFRRSEKGSQVSKGLARACESLTHAAPTEPPRPEGLHRRCPKIPDRGGGSGRGGPPPLQVN